MKYIQIEIGGKKRGCKLGLGFLGEVIDDLGNDVSEIVEGLKKNPYKMIPILMYHSMVYNLKSKGKNPSFTIYDVTDWIEEEEKGFNSDKVVDFLKAFTASIVKDVPISESGPKEDAKGKKKLTGEKTLSATP